jgi:DNA-binding protein H-NS
MSNKRRLQMSDTRHAELAKLEAQKQAQQALIAELDAKAAALRAGLRGDVLAATRKQIKDYGFAAHELFDKLRKPSTAKPKSGKSAPGKAKTIMFQDEQGNTWGGGKGPRPKWVKAIQENNGDIETYRIGKKPAL